MRFFNALALVSALGVALIEAGCSSEDPKPPPWVVGVQNPLPNSADGRLVGSDCPLPMPDVVAECGQLQVPESHANPMWRQLSLPVVVFRSPSPGARELPPVVYLEGGPGGHAIANVVSSFDDFFRPLIKQRDLVVFDQRGTGFATPRLDCPNLGATPMPGLSGAAAPSDADSQLLACRNELSQSTLLDAYNSHENASDVDDLRRALGYEKWHLLGVSYGTRLGLDVARYYPGGVESLILDSVLPPDVDFAASGPVNFKRSLDAVFRSCIEQASCALGYPNLETRFYDLANRLNAEPKLVTNQEGGRFRVSGDLLTSLIFNLSYSAPAVSFMPELIFQLSEGDFGFFEQLSLSDQSAVADGSFSIGMYFSVVCSDYVPFSSAAATEEANRAVPPVIVKALSSIELFSVCKTWNVQAAAPAEHTAVTSALPILLLSGALDPVTPPAWAQSAARSLSNGRALTFNGQAHGIITDPCAGELMNSYWDNPTADPSPKCPNRQLPLEFFVADSRLPAATALPRARGATNTHGVHEELSKVLNHALRERARFR
ncbi:MAG: alpha/beta fold hydrolase [Polyangiaceae bacterium]|nr:alpha/beta fold hydrolase [Polyangiaceae bacterium]